MENFKVNNPTTLHFGKDVVSSLGKVMSNYGKKALLVYGKGSIRSNGIYDQVMAQMQQAGIRVVEYSGIKSNPVIEDVDVAAALGRKEKVDMILAVGGGSVIDSAKIISITIPVAHSGWDFYTGEAKPETAIPLISVLTLAATGTEMNPFAVVQNEAEKKKLGYGHKLIYPLHSFLDPTYTLTVNAGYTAFGIADLMAHSLELWFGEGEAPLTDRFILSIMQEALEAGPLLMEDLNNYDLRARIMFAATMALNGMTAYGKARGDWGVHAFGHVLSLLYDVPHGASLTIVYPAWMRVLLPRIRKRLEVLFLGLFGDPDPEKGIDKLESFFHSLGCPVRLAEFSVGAQSRDDILEVMRENQSNGAVYPLSDLEKEKMVEAYFSLKH